MEKQKSRLNLTLTAVVWGLLALTPLFVETWLLGQLAQFLTYGIFAMSLALVWGQCGLLCFGQALFFGLGAYAMSLVTLKMVPGLEPFAYSWTGLLAAMAIPAVAANLLGRFLFYGRGLKGAYFGIVTLAIAVVAERLATNWDYAGGLNGLINVPPLTLGAIGEGHEIWEDLPVYFIALGLAFAVFLALQGLLRVPFGSVLRAIRDSESRTQYFGYDTAACKLAAFTLGAAVAGLAGALFVTQFSFVSPTLIGFGLSTEVLIWVALGGRQWLLAAFLGAILVKLCEGWLSGLLGPSWLLVLGGLFIASVVFFPGGVIGSLMDRLAKVRSSAAS